MTRLILSRLLQTPLILAAIMALTLALAWIMPGSPVADPGRIPSEEIQQAMLRQYNLDNPFSFAHGYVRGLFLGIEGHPPPYFGPSLQHRDFSVNAILADRLPVSALLGAAALAVALLLGMAAGVLGAWKPGSVWDWLTLLIALLGISLPAFVTGSLLLAGFAVVFGWVPLRPWEWPMGAVWDPQWWADLRQLLIQMLLPTLTLALAPAAYIARLMRLGLAEIMTSDFARTARAKGLSERQVIMRHGVKVAFLPVLSFLGPAAAAVMTGSFVVEEIFAIPGVGHVFVQAVLSKDIFMLLGIVLTYSTLLVLFNLAVDVAYCWIDPRIDLTAPGGR